MMVAFLVIFAVPIGALLGVLVGFGLRNVWAGVLSGLVGTNIAFGLFALIGARCSTSPTEGRRRK